MMKLLHQNHLACRFVGISSELDEVDTTGDVVASIVLTIPGDHVQASSTHTLIASHQLSGHVVNVHGISRSSRQGEA